MNNDNFFRQALQRQNDQAAGMKMPDDMEQRVMKSLKAQTTKRRWLYPLSTIAVAASVLLLILLNIEKQKPEQQTPVVAEVVTEPQDIAEETQATIPTEAIEQPIVAQAEKPQPVKKRRKIHKPIQAEPALQEAEPAQVEPEQENEYLPQQPDLYLMAVAEAQDIRARGERLYEEVAQMMNNH
ncbi:MAG: hypothetical protein IJ537_05475 [Bacteroidaceae bacterium]|nr:hypothetical protein [Bacteroidaceae bacterium]